MVLVANCILNQLIGNRKLANRFLITAPVGS
jgi:hypothetical protein